jgi:hypothetical protein
MLNAPPPSEDQLKEFFARLKTEPESARGVMELTVEILLHQYGAQFTRELVLDALDAAKRKSGRQQGRK